MGPKTTLSVCESETSKETVIRFGKGIFHWWPGKGIHLPKIWKKLIKLYDADLYSLGTDFQVEIHEHHSKKVFRMKPGHKIFFDVYGNFSGLRALIAGFGGRVSLG